QQGEALCEGGDYQAALPAARRALDGARGWGEEHPDHAASLHLLGVVHVGLGQYAEAERHLSRALTIRRQCLGEADPETGQTWQALGRCWAEAGKYQQARTAYHRALGGLAFAGEL